MKTNERRCGSTVGREWKVSKRERERGEGGGREEEEGGVVGR